MTRPLIGCIEHVDFPELGVFGVMAKIDTGAFSGALHCTEIKRVRRGPERIKVLKFKPVGDDANQREATDFLETYVRSASGHRAKRYVITTVISVEGRNYPIRIGLSDRSDMRRPVLIGRRFLRENDLLVDVHINEELDDEGENTK